MIQTRLTNIYKFLEEKWRRKIFRFRTLFIRSLLSLFIGFLIGSLFATFLPLLRQIFRWDGFILVFLLSLSEFLSYIIYHRDERKFIWFTFAPEERNLWELLNIIKTGVFFGLFVDAFKVGS
jgi:Protein of unknown function (DUF565)